MYKVFRNYFSEEELQYIEKLVDSSMPGWGRSAAVGPDTHVEDYSKSRKSVFKSVEPTLVSQDLRDKIAQAVKETNPKFDYEFLEQWSINKYKDVERGHFYWHKDRLEGFLYHGSRIGKMTPEKIFIHNMRPPREMSVSVALNDRSSYNGGQFVIDVGDRKETPIDLDRGDMVVFDSDTYHGVNDVTQGERRALIIWLVDKVRYQQWKEICSEQGIETT